jgi:hypothetical protein
MREMFCEITTIFGGSACCLLQADFLIGLLYDPENGGDMFL